MFIMLLPAVGAIFFLNILPTIVAGSNRTCVVSKLAGHIFSTTSCFAEIVIMPKATSGLFPLIVPDV